MSAAVDEQGARDRTRDVDAARRTMQRKRYFRELQGDPSTTAAPPPVVSDLEVRQGLATARPRFCVSSLVFYYYIPAEFTKVRSKDVSQATRFRIYEVERPQLCAIQERKAPRQSSEEVAALEAQ